MLGATSRVARLAVLPALAASPTARLVCVSSRSQPAGSYATFGALRCAPTYEAVLADLEVEALYVPLPNSLHREWVLAALAAGRHVLCEKPLACNGSEARELAAAAAGVVLMEAYMTPFHPRSAAVANLVAAGGLGPLRFAHAAFRGVLADGDHRWRPDMGGGALLDLGIYTLAPILAAAGGAPDAVAAAARSTAEGVDASFSAWLRFGDATAAIECSFEAPERQWLELAGTEASLSLERAFTPGPGDTTFDLRSRDGTVRTVETGGGDPYLGMVEHFAAAVRGHAALRRGPEASVALAVLLDDLAAAAGLPPRGGMGSRGPALPPP